MKVGEVIHEIVEDLKGVAKGANHVGEVRVQACGMILRAIEVRCELSMSDLDEEV